MSTLPVEDGVMDAGTVLVCSGDLVLAGLLAKNLAQRGFRVHQQVWRRCSDPIQLPEGTDIIVADLGDVQPTAWRRAVRLRQLARDLPLVVLSHDWPPAQRLDTLQPCSHVRKPLAIDELLMVLRRIMRAEADE